MTVIATLGAVRSRLMLRQLGRAHLVAGSGLLHVVMVVMVVVHVRHVVMVMDDCRILEYLHGHGQFTRRDQVLGSLLRLRADESCLA